MKTIAVANQKGGVGKTNICFNAAGVLAELGQKVLIIDMDAQVTMSGIFLDKARRTKPSVYHLLDEDPVVEVNQVIRSTHLENIDLLPGSVTLRRLDSNLSGVTEANYFLRDVLQETSNNYNVILIDCPPSLNQATRMALVAADAIIAPLQCTEESFQASGILLGEIEHVKQHLNPKLKFLGFVINLYMPRRSMQQDYYQVIKEQLKDKLFKTEFRNHTEYAETIPKKSPITFYKPKSDQANLYRQFVKEFF